MSAVVVEIADAVVDTIEAATLSLTCSAERVYVPVHELKDLDGLKVSVVPTGLTITPLSRSSDDCEYVIDVGVQKKVGQGAMTQAEINTACDPLVLFCEEIADLFRSGSIVFAAYNQARCVLVANQPIYVPAHIDEFRVFTSVISLTFRLAR